MRFGGIGNVNLGTFKATTGVGAQPIRPQQTLATWAVLHNPTGAAQSIYWGPNPNEFLEALKLDAGKWYNLAPEAAFDLSALYFKAADNAAGTILEVLYAYQA